MSSQSGGGASLVLGYNDCNSEGEAARPADSQSTLDEFAENGDDGRYDCRRHFNYPEMVYVDEDNSEYPFRCGSWECYCCGYRMRQNLIEEIKRVVRARPELRRFLTLTLDPKKLPKAARNDDDYQAAYIMETWRKFRVYIQREYGDFSFIWVKEKQDNGNWHLHVLISRYLDQAWISRSWQALGGGEVVDIRRVNHVEKAAHYLGKYLTKNALSDFPDNVKRYGTSEDIELDVRGNSDDGSTCKLLIDDRDLRPDDEPIRRGVVPADFVHEEKPPPG